MASISPSTKRGGGLKQKPLYLRMMEAAAKSKQQEENDRVRIICDFSMSAAS
jgi:hypothetical protein